MEEIIQINYFKNEINRQMDIYKYRQAFIKELKRFLKGRKNQCEWNKLPSHLQKCILYCYN